MYQKICEKLIKICPKCVQKADRNNFHILHVFFKESTSQKGPSECPWTALGRLVASIGRLLGASWRALGASWEPLGASWCSKACKSLQKGLPKASQRLPEGPPKAAQSSQNLPKERQIPPSFLLATLLPLSSDVSLFFSCSDAAEKWNFRAPSSKHEAWSCKPNSGAES